MPCSQLLEIGCCPVRRKLTTWEGMSTQRNLTTLVADNSTGDGHKQRPGRLPRQCPTALPQDGATLPLMPSAQDQVLELPRFQLHLESSASQVALLGTSVTLCFTVSWYPVISCMGFSLPWSSDEAREAMVLWETLGVGLPALLRRASQA